MRTFHTKDLSEVKKMKDGEIGIYEYTDCGIRNRERFMVVDGEMYFETTSCYNDRKTGKPLECFCRFDEDEDMWTAVKNLDGTIELVF
ncbi:MAG TPA: hypothetical protein DGX96_03980 [Lachnospiraceae bacterium]|jgi:hypothetical protein|nr:hypothetical protein [Lachnospiraceae bacterium]